MEGFWVGMSSGIIDEVLPALESLNGFDFAPLGKSIGDKLGAGIEIAMAAFKTVNSARSSNSVSRRPS